MSLWLFYYLWIVEVSKIKIKWRCKKTLSLFSIFFFFPFILSPTPRPPLPTLVFSWNKKSCKFYSNQLGAYGPYFLHNKGRPLVGLLDQWVGLRKVLLEHALPQNWTKAKRQEWPFKLLPLSSKATKSFLWGYLFVMENLKETLQWFFNYIFNGNKGGFIVKKWLENSLLLVILNGHKRMGWYADGKIKPSTYNRKWSM